MAAFTKLRAWLGAVALGLAFALSPPAAAGDIEQGRIKAHLCIGCHNIPGYLIAFPTVYHVPRIWGQSADYIVYALKEYANGTRYGKRLNRLASMPAIATTLTEQDMEDLAAYYSSLGDL